ncbi:hypothetical protein PLESTF_000463500, partial [Pleodorina starrii]
MLDNRRTPGILSASVPAPFEHRDPTARTLKARDCDGGPSEADVAIRALSQLVGAEQCTLNPQASAPQRCTTTTTTSNSPKSLISTTTGGGGGGGAGGGDGDVGGDGGGGGGGCGITPAITPEPEPAAPLQWRPPSLTSHASAAAATTTAAVAKGDRGADAATAAVSDDVSGGGGGGGGTGGGGGVSSLLRAIEITRNLSRRVATSRRRTAANAEPTEPVAAAATATSVVDAVAAPPPPPQGPAATAVSIFTTDAAIAGDGGVSAPMPAPLAAPATQHKATAAAAAVAAAGDGGAAALPPAYSSAPLLPVYNSRTKLPYLASRHMSQIAFLQMLQVEDASGGSGGGDGDTAAAAPPPPPLPLPLPLHPPYPPPQQLPLLWTLNLAALSREITGLRLIGQGGGGVVFQGVWQGAQVAVKILLNDPDSDSSDGDVLALEGVVSSVVNHPNVVHTFEFQCGRLTEAAFAAAEYDNYNRLDSLLEDQGNRELFESLLDTTDMYGGIRASYGGSGAMRRAGLNASTATTTAVVAAAGAAAGAAGMAAATAPSRHNRGQRGGGGPQTSRFGSTVEDAASAGGAAGGGGDGGGDDVGDGGGDDVGAVTAAGGADVESEEEEGESKEAEEDVRAPPPPPRRNTNTIEDKCTAADGSGDDDDDKDGRCASGGGDGGGGGRRRALVTAAAAAGRLRTEAATRSAVQAQQQQQQQQEQPQQPQQRAAAAALGVDFSFGGGHVMQYGMFSMYGAAQGFGDPECGSCRGWTVRQALQHLKARPGMNMTYIIMEYCDRGSLLVAIRRGIFRMDEAGPAGRAAAATVAVPASTSSPNAAPAAAAPARFTRRIVLRAILRTARDIAQGMCHLHANGIIHGDLKPGNVLLRGCRSDRRGFVAMVADFGLSKVTRGDKPLELNHWSTVTVMAPEVIMGRWLKASDVFSYGVLLWQLVTSEPVPYGKLTIPQILMGVSQGTLKPEWYSSAHPALVRLGRACLATSPEKRPSFEAIVKVRN